MTVRVARRYWGTTADTEEGICRAKLRTGGIVRSEDNDHEEEWSGGGGAVGSKGMEGHKKSDSNPFRTVDATM